MASAFKFVIRNLNNAVKGRSMPINTDYSEMKYKPYWIIWIKNTNDRHDGGIEFKDARRHIESPVRILSDLLRSGSHIGEHKSWADDVVLNTVHMRCLLIINT